MGNALSPVISNLYMEFYETILLPKVLPPNVIWYRYVDDVICLWPQTINPDNFLIKLNLLNPDIQFTMEREQNGSIPFLDLKLFRQDKDIRFTVYRKPTNVSNHNLQTKK